MQTVISPIDQLPSPAAIEARLAVIDLEAALLRQLMRLVRRQQSTSKAAPDRPRAAEGGRCGS